MSLRVLFNLLARGPRLLFLGDSHLGPVQHAHARGWLAPCRVRFVKVGGATAVGLRHPKSKTQALLRYRETLARAPRDTVPVFQLGEVDCGFVIWHRAAKYGESVEEQLEAALSTYAGFLSEVIRMGFGSAIVTSAMLPTIRDGQLSGEVAHLRRSVTASQAERTHLTLAYNRRLAETCAGLGLRFVDFTPDLLDPATGVIADRFRHPDPLDHHLHPDLGGRLWAERLLPLVT